MATDGPNSSTECQICPIRAETNMLMRRIGHDLRGPLRALQILPDWITEEFEEAETKIPSQASEYMDMIKQKTRQMDDLLSGLLEYAQVANPDIAATRINPGADIEQLAQSSLKAGSYEITIDPALTGINVVQEDFRILFRHLLTNATRHHGNGNAYIRITGHLEGNMAVFSVADNGPGIEEKFHQSIFEPFVTLKPRDEVEGSGLGLAVVKKIAKSWHGDISAASGSGKGSVFRLLLPVYVST